MTPRPRSFAVRDPAATAPPSDNIETVARLLPGRERAVTAESGSAWQRPWRRSGCSASDVKPQLAAQPGDMMRLWPSVRL